MSANFNRIAPVYDQIAFLVYGNKLRAAKEEFFSLIPEKSRILLMGGGTGNILNDLFRKKPATTVDFIEPSERMISIAEKRLDVIFHPRVNFICGDENKIPQAIKYDVCTSFFVMDIFSQDHAVEFARKITAQLLDGGMWLFADFFNSRRTTQRFLLQFMYLFFKIISNIETQSLPDYEKIFNAFGFTAEREKQFMNGFVRSILLRKN